VPSARPRRWWLWLIVVVVALLLPWVVLAAWIIGASSMANWGEAILQFP
jgi:hypothetical protein